RLVAQQMPRLDRIDQIPVRPNERASADADQARGAPPSRLRDQREREQHRESIRGGELRTDCEGRRERREAELSTRRAADEDAGSENERGDDDVVLRAGGLKQDDGQSEKKQGAERSLRTTHSEPACEDEDRNGAGERREELDETDQRLLARHAENEREADLPVWR